MIQKRLKLLAVIFTATLFVFTNFALAAVKGDQGLTLSPPVKELSLKTGEKTTETVTLTNPTSQLVTLYPKVMNFSAKNETGEPGFSDPSQSTSKYSLASWITLTSPVVALTPQQVVEYKYTITVPQDAEPGGHYGVVFFATQPPETNTSSSQVSLASMVGSLVLVTVPGDLVESGKIQEFSTDKGLYASNNVTIDTRILNNGNVHFAPKGEIDITNMFGQKVDTLSFNDVNGNVLPDSIRKFENRWSSNKLLFGRFVAKANLAYGNPAQSMVATTTFWVMPLWATVPAGLVTVLLVAAAFGFIAKGRRAKAKNSNSSGSSPQGPPILR